MASLEMAPASARRCLRCLHSLAGKRAAGWPWRSFPFSRASLAGRPAGHKLARWDNNNIQLTGGQQCGASLAPASVSSEPPPHLRTLEEGACEMQSGSTGHCSLPAAAAHCSWMQPGIWKWHCAVASLAAHSPPVGRRNKFVELLE